VEIQESKDIIKESILVRYFNYHTDMFSDEELGYLSNHVNYEKVDDRLIVHDERVRNVVNWECIDRMKMIRIIIGLFDIGESVPEKADLSKFDYKIKEVKHLLRRRPEYCESFKFDLTKIKLFEAHMLLCMGKDYFFEKIPIEKYRFNEKEIVDIIRSYNYEERIMNRLKVELLKGYNISEVLKEKGESYIKYFDLKKLNAINWIDLIESRAEFFNHLNLDSFLKEDVYYTIQLATLYSKDVLSQFKIPNLIDLIVGRGIENISPLGWEKLLIYDPDRFIDICDFSSLNELNWARIKVYRPELLVFKL
jgi:hypothetical protein